MADKKKPGEDDPKTLAIKQSLLAAKELASQIPKFEDGDDIEEHLRKVEDYAELMMVDDTVKYQAMLLSLDELTRSEFHAWLKTENYQAQVKGKPDELKKRLLEKFRVRRSVLERINFVLQPRRHGTRLVVDLLERKRVYDEVFEEMKKNREKLFVEAAMQLLGPEQRADYGNIRPEEEKRTTAELIEFVRRKEEERFREKKLESLKNEEEEEPKKKNQTLKKAKKKTTAEEEDEEEERVEREHLMVEGRCFICRDLGHIAADCPDNPKNRVKKKRDEDGQVQLPTVKKKTDEDRRRGGANSF